MRNEHTHTPDETGTVVLEIRQNLKRKVIEESGAIDRVSNVFTKYYPIVIVPCCLFHYGHCLFRKFVDRGLKTAYKDDENLRDWFRSLATLSLQPLKHMLFDLQYLIHIRPSYSSIPIS
ncbi:unnamed protein product [Rotaria sp. Silwood1]|nr:unnamed protein product [Rotaria sp. Silwood1]CAF3946620.1 unnamed protein product [Rotaria sp. Silwood1]CAF4615652.1 unnamed protein product [Rotaria sp. Silwood1]